MAIGDLVRLKAHGKYLNCAIGIVLRTPQQTNNGEFEVCWVAPGYDPHTMYNSEEILEVINASR